MTRRITAEGLAAGASIALTAPPRRQPAAAVADSASGTRRSSTNGENAASNISAAAAVSEPRRRQRHDRDDHELGQDDCDQDLDEPPAPARRGGPDHRHEGERQEEDRDIDRGRADEQLEPNAERGCRRHERAEEDRKQRDRIGAAGRGEDRAECLAGVLEELRGIRSDRRGHRVRHPVGQREQQSHDGDRDRG
jgi:hypothetical protein